MTGAYLYGVVGSGRLVEDAFDDLPSVDGRHPVRLASSGGVAAIVSSVPLDEFDESTLPSRLNDIEWLEPAARRHEAVLERALAGGGVVPFRFCTIYRSEEELGRFVSEREAELHRVLGRVEGRVEIGVKGLVARDVLEQALGPKEQGDDAEGAGRAYLLRKQRDRTAREEAASAVRTCAAAAARRLEAVAVAAELMPVRPVAEETMFLNGAYLVPAGDDSVEREAAALTREYAPFGIRFEVTGPWPPYNFVPRDVAS